MNALWHGAFADSPVLPGEDPAAFSQLLDDLRRHYQPASPAEEALVSHLARVAWRLPHLAAMETRVLLAHLHRRSSGVSFVRAVKKLGLKATKLALQNNDLPDPLAAAWLEDAQGRNALGSLLRCQNALERSYYRALHELEYLRAQRLSPPPSQVSAPRG
jgi:hypothetical protein